MIEGSRSIAGFPYYYARRKTQTGSMKPVMSPALRL